MSHEMYFIGNRTKERELTIYGFDEEDREGAGTFAKELYGRAELICSSVLTYSDHLSVCDNLKAEKQRFNSTADMAHFVEQKNGSIFCMVELRDLDELMEKLGCYTSDIKFKRIDLNHCGFFLSSHNFYPPISAPDSPVTVAPIEGISHEGACLLS